MASSFMRFLDLTQRCTTVGRTPLDGWSARQHNTHNRHPCLRGDSNPQSPKRASVDLRLRLRAQQDWRLKVSTVTFWHYHLLLWWIVTVLLYITIYYRIFRSIHNLLMRVTRGLMNFICYVWILRTAVARWLRCCVTNRKVAGSIPDGVIRIFHWHSPSDRTMALGSTQPLTEMSTRSISWE